MRYLRWLLPWVLLVATAWCQDKAAVVYGKAGKMDMMINQNVFMMGVKPYTADTGREVFELEPQFRAVAKESIQRMAQQGYSPIILVGSEYADMLGEIATSYPASRFVIIDAMVDLPNVKSVVFAEHEGSFVVGAAASLVSQNKKLGFIGGMESPMIRKYSCGFAQGAKYVDSTAQVDVNMAGTTKSGFKKPEYGERLAQMQIETGVDVIYQVAGHTHIGVFNAVEQHEGVYGIGSMNNQNWMRPGHILTSMVKQAGMVTRRIMEEVHQGEWTPGIFNFGLKQGGIDWAVDQYSLELLEPHIVEKVNAIKAGIISGEIEVHNYMSDKTCPV